MNRINLLWGFGGAIIGAVATYFVMEYIYEKELQEYFGVEDGPVLDKAINELSKKKVIDIMDAEGYSPGVVLDKFHHVIGEEIHAEEEEGMVMEAIWMDENGQPGEDSGFSAEDEDEKTTPVESADTFEKIIFEIEVAQVNPGRRIVARFNHDDCSLDISSVMSAKNDILDERVEETELEELLGLECYNILMNSEPDTKERMLGVRNNVINLDFAISY